MMKALQNALLLICLSGLVMLGSCSTTNVGMADLVDPQISKLEDDGKYVWVNVGLVDGVRVGQRFWVVRDRKIAGLLSARDLRDYSAKCLIVGSKSLRNLTATKAVEPADPAVGDRVARTFFEVAGGTDIRNRVPRYVTVRTDVGELEGEVDALLSPEDRAKKERLKRIPREEYEKWKRTHLPPPPPGG